MEVGCDECDAQAAAGGGGLPSLGGEEVLVFTYGTLKRGFCNHYNMHRPGVHYWQDGETELPYVLYLDHLNRHRPCLVDGRLDGEAYDHCAARDATLAVGRGAAGLAEAVGCRVRGELYRVAAAALPGLDEFEKVPSNYRRYSIPAKGLADGKRCSVEVYFMRAAQQLLDSLRTGEYVVVPEYTIELHVQCYVPRRENALGHFHMSRQSLKSLAHQSDDEERETVDTNGPPSVPGGVGDSEDQSGVGPCGSEEDFLTVAVERCGGT